MQWMHYYGGILILIQKTTARKEVGPKVNQNKTLTPVIGIEVKTLKVTYY